MKPTRATSVAYLFVLLVAAALYCRTPKDCGSVPDDAEYVEYLPQLIYIGDGVSKGIFRYLQPLLPQWQLFHPAEELQGACRNSNVGVSCTRRWLGKRPWDVVAFNFGLHDIAHNHERVGATQYQANLHLIVRQIRAQCPNATIIWGSTTPVPRDSLDLRPPRSDFDVIGYNGLARDVMELEGVEVIRMYSVVSTKEQLADDIYFSDTGYEQMAHYLARHIQYLP